MADRFGSKPVTITAFLLAVAAVLALSVDLPLAAAMVADSIGGMPSSSKQFHRER
ncbi:hypothetical protein [Nocardia fusca]|uniref:hypothetical protein n=1 Tax=Nocardia fusca TaxID=941183 RepID=UPI000ACED6D5|nr:hypothetical protein [Nocardia fusca]